MPHTFAQEVLVVFESALAIEVSVADGEAEILEVVGPSAGMRSGRLLSAARRPPIPRALVPTTLISLSERGLARLESARQPAGGCRLVRANEARSCHPLRDVSATLIPLRLRHFVKQ